MRHSSSPLVLAAFSVCVLFAGSSGVVAAAAASPRVQIVVEPSAEGGKLAAEQMKHWQLTGGATIATSDRDAAATAADGVTIFFRESKKPGASIVVSGSPAAKGTVDAIAAKLVEDAGKAEKSAAPTTMPAAIEAGDDAAIAAATRSNARVIVVSAPAARGMPVSDRARVFRVATAQVLSEIGGYAGSVDVVLPPRSAGTLHVGIYDGKGSNNSPGPEAMWSILEKTDKSAFTYVGPRDINPESLKQFDILVFPGGSGGGQGNALGKDGREAIRSFVAGGGAYIGNCAGGYLASTSYPWSLNLLNVKTLDTDNGKWARGSGDVQVELTDEGRKLLGDHQTVTIRYANGPIYGLGDSADLPPVKVLAYYRTELAKNGATKGAMVNTPAIVAAPFGKGRVVAFSCHPEYSKDYTDFVRNAMKWVTSKE